MSVMSCKALLCFVFGLAAAMGNAWAAAGGIADRAVRSDVAGVDLIIYPMGARDVVTLVGSLQAGDLLAGQEGSNLAAATLVGMMLDKGTTKRDKFAISRELDDVGAALGFSVGAQTTSIHGRSLKKDVALLIRLLAEEMRHPAFPADELEKVKKQLESGIRSQLENTDFRARDAFSRYVYPEGHPNRPRPPQEWINALNRATVEDVKAFHRKHYGSAQLRLAFVGDVEPEVIQAEVRKAFGGWSSGSAVASDGTETPTAGAAGPVKKALERKASDQSISLADKASVSVMLGQATGLRYQDPDRLALSVGTSILGSGFIGRLMSTVRDKEGLTYGIGAGLSDDSLADGSWAISASFAPALLEQGVASTRRELEKWWREGVTESELEVRKSNLIGGFRIGLSTTYGMASALMDSIERGVGIEWLDRYPQAVEALTSTQVNQAIRKYLDPRKMVLVKAGTLEAS
jgi:zinc protease